ncbi:hypothetical protein RSOLAG22IIIB_12096 [Rhizoctonia solani]|uniref:BTB domain-containing protein n=1 Tax=Rhizoctonia solani TaxID=456999 RepID=A0A0K6GC40_9AGAM|nr:hypothetical protein RSOLAG22IIIB_12096 [Rhizoctonia solani]
MLDIKSGASGFILVLDMDHETTYTILIKDTTFTLSHSQVTFESPNYFTTCFLGDFAESQTRSVRLERSPDMFPFIRNYLCGYMVLPLSNRSIPKGMSMIQAISHLRADAMFYQLEGLVGQCDEHLEPLKKGLPVSHRYLIVGWEPSKRTSARDLRNLSMEDLDDLVPTVRQLGWHLYLTKREFKRLGFQNMMPREEFIKGGAEGMLALTSVSSTAEKVFPSAGRKRWIVGVINKCDSETKDEQSDGSGDSDSDSDSGSGSEDGQKDGGFEGFDGEVTVVMLEE